MARPAPSGPIQVSASTSIQSPAGSREKFTVRSALRNVHSRKSSTDEVPLQKSAAAIVRIACETGAPSTIGRSTRYQIAPGPDPAEMTAGGAQRHPRHERTR